MKIAVTYEQGQVFQHFGHSEQFKIYETEGGKVVASKVIDAAESGHGALAGMLMMQGVDAVICGGIGGGAQAALKGFGIKVYGGVQGECDAAVESLLAGTLEATDAPNCSHHDHEHGEGHTCGDHCGGNCHH